VNEQVDVTNCGGQADCQDGNVCLTHHLWADLSGRIHDFLHDISLETLVSKPDVQNVSARQDRIELERTAVAVSETIAVSQLG
jgi:Rrf2 family iron-sulfur cluster assembly transcriptional regulator